MLLLYPLLSEKCVTESNTKDFHCFSLFLLKHQWNSLLIWDSDTLLTDLKGGMEFMFQKRILELFWNLELFRYFVRTYLSFLSTYKYLERRIKWDFSGTILRSKFHENLQNIWKRFKSDLFSGSRTDSNVI